MIQTKAKNKKRDYCGHNEIFSNIVCISPNLMASLVTLDVIIIPEAKEKKGTCQVLVTLYTCHQSIIYFIHNDDYILFKRVT